MSSRGTRSVISLQGSAAGPSLFDSLDGPTTEPSGQALVLASPSVLRAGRKATKTAGMSGQRCSGSSASAALQSCLGSRLRQRFAWGGSMEYVQTWKKKITPWGRTYWAHTASARRTSDTGFFGWPTPNVPNGGRSCHTMSTTGVMPDGTKRQAGLEHVAKHAGWNTPRATDGSNGGPNQLGGALPADAAKAGWCTPASRDWKDSPGMAQTGINPDGTVRYRSDQLPRQVVLIGGYPTPQARDVKGTCQNAAKLQARLTRPNASSNLNDTVMLIGGYPTPQALSFDTSHQPGMNRAMQKTILFFVGTPTIEGGKKCGVFRLNLYFSLWLMGFNPAAWWRCGARATQSCRRLPRRSSKRTCK